MQAYLVEHEVAFPVSAGINRKRIKSVCVILCIPRKRGDQPHRGTLIELFR